jgi:hypothetical protein
VHRLRVFMPQPALFTTCVAANQSLVAELIHVLCFTQTASGLLEHAERSSRKGISPWMISSVRRLAPFHPTPFPAPPRPFLARAARHPFCRASRLWSQSMQRKYEPPHTHTHTHTHAWSIVAYGSRSTKHAFASLKKTPWARRKRRVVDHAEITVGASMVRTIHTPTLDACRGMRRTSRRPIACRSS